VRYRRIIGLGLCVVDHLYVVEKLDWADTRVRYSERRVSSGGMMATALAQAAVLGCDTQVLSLVGDDEDGRFVRRSLRVAGVKTGRLILSQDLPTTVALILVKRRGGERRFLVPDRRALESGAPRFDLASIGRKALLMVDGHFPEQALRAVKRAREVGASVMGPCSPSLTTPWCRSSSPWSTARAIRTRRCGGWRRDAVGRPWSRRALAAASTCATAGSVASPPPGSTCATPPARETCSTAPSRRVSTLAANFQTLSSWRRAPRRSTARRSAGWGD
jgi:hypothetical protein